MTIIQGSTELAIGIAGLYFLHDELSKTKGLLLGFAVAAYVIAGATTATASLIFGDPVMSRFSFMGNIGSQLCESLSNELSNGMDGLNFSFAIVQVYFGLFTYIKAGEEPDLVLKEAKEKIRMTR